MFSQAFSFIWFAWSIWSVSLLWPFGFPESINTPNQIDRTDKIDWARATRQCPLQQALYRSSGMLFMLLKIVARSSAFVTLSIAG